MSSAEEEQPLENRRRTRSASRALSNGGEEEGNEVELVELPEREEEEVLGNDEDEASTSQDDDDEADDEDYDGEDDGDEDTQEEVVIPSEVVDDEEVSKVTEVSQILKIWEERLAADPNSAAANDNDNPQRHNFNPVPILTRLSEIIEYETNEYLKLDPDPFDDRHPSRTHPESSLGQSLKVLFKKEVFLNKLVGLYCKDGWGDDQMDLAVNTAACRLFVNVLPGLEATIIFEESISMIQRLFQWAEFAPEPLQSYSLGLLGGAMEISEIAAKFRDKNSHLVQVMLRRLKQLQQEFHSSGQRPFAHLGHSNSTPNQHNSDEKSEVSAKVNEFRVNATPVPHVVNGDGHDGILKDPRLLEHTPMNGKVRGNTPNRLLSKSSVSDTQNGTTPAAGSVASYRLSNIIATPSNKESPHSTTPRSTKRTRLAGTTPASKSFVEPSSACKSTPKRRKLSTSILLEDCSSTSSSWAEMQPNIIGSWQVYPVNLVTRQIFTLRYLSPVGEYQDMLSYAFENSAVQIILRYLSKSHLNNRDSSRLTFEALKYLGALLCHKKFAMEFLSAGGLQRLLQVPRPSLSATGVSLCLYYIAYCEDAMEKVCLMSKTTLQNLMNYAVWLMECSHNTGRNNALMFFSVIYPFKTMLDLFDAQDGLRSVLNVISTQPNFASVIREAQQLPLPPGQLEEANDTELNEDDQMIAKQNVRQVSFNLKRYFECHLYFTADKLKRTIGRSQNPQQVVGPTIPPYKQIKLPNPSDLSSLHATVLALLPVNAPRWAPVERFLNQSGIHIIMATIALAYEWNYSGRAETVKNMLDVLAICCLVPKAQLLLIERFSVNNNTEHNGMHIVLSASDGDVVNDTEVKKSALQVIGNCVCGPIHHKKPSETQIKLWECSRMNNGILVLTRLLQTKSPITDADSIRALACWCLSGLARYKQVRQVLQQLPLIRAGLIQNLMTEPILQDKRQDHVMFQKYALEIIKLVHGKDEHYTLELGDLIRKTDLISQTRIKYDERQLMELIQNHLSSAGLTDTAQKLKEELSSKKSITLKRTTSIGNNCLPSTSTPVQSSSSVQQQQDPHTSPEKQVSLDKIVKEYLLSQHALCKTPMVTCPQFDLFVPHKCPSKADFGSVYRTTNFRSNFASRMMNREILGCGSSVYERKLIYSKYKPCRVIRSADLSEEATFTSCAFSPCYQWTIVGTSSGDVKLFNNSNSNEDGTYSCHDSEIYHLQPNSKGTLLLTSSVWRRPLSAVWKMENLFDKVMDFEREEYVEFNKWGQDKVIATNMEHAAVYDIETKKRILTLHPRVSNSYLRNRATFDPFDDLILSDGVLWDFKSGKEIHKFDKLNENVSGVFNLKNGIEIISNTEIWDTRTFHLLKTVRQLDQCHVQFSNDNSIIYAYKLDREETSNDNGVQFRHGDTSFVVLDNYADYSSVATIELKRHIMNLAVSPNDLQLALVENHSVEDSLGSDSCVRYYEVGRSKADDVATGLDDEDDLQSDDEEVDDHDEDDDDDDDDDNNEPEDDEEGNGDDLDQILDGLLPQDGNVDVIEVVSDGEGGEYVFQRHEDSDDDDDDSWEDTSGSESSSY